MGGGGRHRHNTDLYYNSAQCNIPEEHKSEKASRRRGPVSLALKEDQTVAGHSEYVCDGCFYGSEGCRDPEKGQIPSTQDAREGLAEMATTA